MYVLNRFLGSFINKLTWFVLIAIIGLICFFGGLWVANAETCTSLNITGTSATFTTTTPSNIGEYYSHDKIRDVIPTLLNNNDTFKNYYGTYTLYNFYQRFNYAVIQQDGEYYRIYYQDINFLRSISCANVDNKFYIGSYFSTGNYNYNLNIPYSFYIDIHFNLSDSSIVIDNISTLSENLNALTLNNRKFSSYPSWSSWSFNIPLVDSYNGLQLLNNIESVGYEAYIESLNSYFDNKFPNIVIINSNSNNINELSLYFSGSEVTEDTEEPDPDNPGGVDLTQIEEDLKDILGKQEEALNNQVIANGFLEGIGSTVNDFFEATTKGLGDILELLKKPFDSSETSSNFFDDFEIEDNGGISQVVTLPLNFIQDLLNNNDSCDPLTLTIFDKEVAIPSGCIMWDKVPDNVETVYHTFICGFYSLLILNRIFKDVENFKNPNHNEVSTLDL